VQWWSTTKGWTYLYIRYKDNYWVFPNLCNTSESAKWKTWSTTSLLTFPTVIGELKQLVRLTKVVFKLVYECFTQLWILYHRFNLHVMGVHVNALCFLVLQRFGNTEDFRLLAKMKTTNVIKHVTCDTIISN